MYAMTQSKALVGTGGVSLKPRMARRAPVSRGNVRPISAFAGSFEADAVVTAARWILAVPTCYALASVNEYVTHRYFQHCEFNKNEMMQKVYCMVTGKDKAPKIRGGFHIEHHAETLDDMSLKTDPKWIESEPAACLKDSKYRGTAFEYNITGAMIVQMLPTSIPVLMFMGFSFPTTMGLIVATVLLHGLVWNSLHPAMHGLEEIPASEGLPSLWLAGLRSTGIYDYLYKNHQGHHVMSGNVNYNVCCPLVDHLVGTYVPPEQWMPKAKLPAGSEDRPKYVAGEYKERLAERARNDTVMA